jgi:hypothetical protein
VLERHADRLAECVGRSGESPLADADIRRYAIDAERSTRCLVEPREPRWMHGAEERLSIADIAFDSTLVMGMISRMQ